MQQSRFWVVQAVEEFDAVEREGIASVRLLAMLNRILNCFRQTIGREAPAQPQQGHEQ